MRTVIVKKNQSKVTFWIKRRDVSVFHMHKKPGFVFVTFKELWFASGLEKGAVTTPKCSI